MVYRLMFVDSGGNINLQYGDSSHLATFMGESALKFLEKSSTLYNSIESALASVDRYHRAKNVNYIRVQYANDKSAEIWNYTSNPNDVHDQIDDLLTV